MEEKDIGNFLFQKDEATSHIAETTLDVLCSVFEYRIISAELMFVGHWELRFDTDGLLFVGSHQRYLSGPIIQR